MTRWERSRARLQARADASVGDTALYPTPATTASGAAFRVRIEALDTPAISVDGEGLTGSSNNSHMGHLPAGVQLQPGEVITTADSDRYMVVPPVQRSSLGDQVGLSWQGSGAAPRPPLPAPASPDPTPDATPATPPPTSDDWWNEGLS